MTSAEKKEILLKRVFPGMEAEADKLISIFGGYDHDAFDRLWLAGERARSIFDGVIINELKTFDLYFEADSAMEWEYYRAAVLDEFGDRATFVNGTPINSQFLHANYIGQQCTIHLHTGQMIITPEFFAMTADTPAREDVVDDEQDPLYVSLRNYAKLNQVIV